MTNQELITSIDLMGKRCLIRKEGWGGAEYRVSSLALGVPQKKLSEIEQKNIKFDYVLKEPKKTNYIDTLTAIFPAKKHSEKSAIKKLSKYMNSEEHFLVTKKDYELARNILGDLVPECMFLKGPRRTTNKAGLYIIQKKVHGQTWKEYSKGISWKNNYAFILEKKEQLSILIVGAMKILIETGGTIDIWENNLMLDENDNFVIVDIGTPSELQLNFNTLLKLPFEMRRYLAINTQKRLEELESYINFLEIKQYELKQLQRKLNFTSTEYVMAKDKLMKTLESLKKTHT